MNTSEQVAKKANETSEKISDGVHDAIDKAANMANQAADTLSEKSEKIKETQEKIVHECRGYVRENPMTSLAIAAGVGFLLSKLTR